MISHDLIQGSAAWLAHRAKHFNASDAPAMMGCSPYESRTQLLHRMHTGLSADVDAGTQRRFDDGHRLEALDRPLAEQIVGEDFYPVTGSEGRYSASFDGLTLGEDVAFEHKTLNDGLRSILPSAGIGGSEVGAALPPRYRIQMEQQCMVSGAGRVLFGASTWDADDNLTEARWCWYEPDAELRAEIIAGWAQFEKDLATYTPPPAAEPAPVGKAPDTLPALRIEVTGMVTASNLAEFKQTALTAIRSVNRDLKTDADFADADKAVKWCADVEARLKAAKEHALSQTASIDELFKALDDIAAESKAVRLDLAKVIDRRKMEVKEQAVTAARKALDAHIAALNAELAPMRLLPVPADFAGAIKGLRSIASMQGALDDTLAGAKIAADGQARGIRANLAHFKKTTETVEFLFSDLGVLVHKSPDDFEAILAGRIRTHLDHVAAREKQRQADEAQRIAAAEQRAREQEAARIAEQQRQEQAAAARKAAEARAEAAAAVGVIASPGQYPPPAGPVLSDKATADASAVAFVQRVESAAAEPATLKLGVICERLGFTVSAAFLADALHVKPAKSDGAARLYREAQFQVICSQLQAHISAMAELYTPEGVA